MAQDSKKVRRERRLRRNLSLALQIAQDALRERDQARYLAISMRQELEKRDNPPELESPDLTIKTVEEPETQTTGGQEADGQTDQTDRQD